jgi:4-amino-4-deoxy-L-arabinose transferase-like glycosyltransferase
MYNQTKSNSPSLQKYHLIVIFVSYAVFALVFGFAYRFAMNPDGTSILRLAGYIAEGNFQQSISPGYSPLLTWVISPFIFLGFDALTAARIAIALCGAGLLLSSWFLAQRFNLSENIRFAAVLIASLLTAFWTIQFIAADVLFAALTLFYLYLVTDQNVLTGRMAAFYCGIVSGFMYLGHHYAMPFFFAHFPVILLARGYMVRDSAGLPWKKILLALGSGIAGFLIIASLWIGIISVKKGHVTISIKGGVAHAVMGPKDVDRRHPFFVGGLFKPKDDYSIHVFEDPSEVEFKTWSPFESKEYFIHQLKVIKDNSVYIFNHFVNNSPFFTYALVIVVLALFPIALFLNTMNSRKRFLYFWVVITFCIYCSGFLLLIARSPRRFYAMMIVFLFTSFHFIEEFKYAIKDSISEQRKRSLAIFLFIIIVSAFALKPFMQLVISAKHIITVEQINPYKEIAERINTVDFTAPYAVIRSSQKVTTDYYMAYFLDKQVLGRPRSIDVDGVTDELKSAGGRSLLVFDNPEIAGKLKLDGRYLYKGSIKLNSSDRYEHAAKWVIAEHEIINGWDEEVSIFTLK